MENVVIAFIVVVVVIAFIGFYYTNREFMYMTSTFDGHMYYVSRDSPSPVLSADTLAILNSRILVLKKHLLENFPDHHVTSKLVKRYSYKVLSEAPVYQGYTTYTVNKSDILLCIKTRDDNKDLYDVNLLMYVLLHELAHMCNETVGHDDSFRQVFKFLVKESIRCDIYKFENYYKKPKEYCGITLDSVIHYE